MTRSLITVGVASPFPIFRAGLRAALHATQDIHIVAESGDAAVAAVLFRKAQPMAVLLDPLLYVVERALLDALCDDTDGPVCLCVIPSAMGISRLPDMTRFTGMLTYADEAEDYIRALRRAVAGKRYVSDTLPAQLVAINHSNHDQASFAADQLTSTERKVVQRLGEGKTSRQIAEELFISYRTVQKHRSNIVAKLGLRGSNALFVWALLQHGE